MKAILFDMDGTLMNSMGMWYGLGNAYLEELGVEPDVLDFNKMITMGMEEVTRYLKKYYNVSEDNISLNDFVHKKVENFYENEVELLPGVLEKLEQLRELGIPMALGTATEEKNAARALKCTGIGHYFEFIYTTSTEGVLKSDTHFYERAADKFKVETKNLILFDDAVDAVDAARKSGCLAVGVEDVHYNQDIKALKENSDIFLHGLLELNVEKFKKYLLEEAEI